MEQGACAKHFPGLGSLPFSTDEHPYVRGHVRDADLAPYRAAVEGGVPCVMVGHGVYPSLGPRRATLEPATYRLLHELGFDGVAITDSLDVVRGHATEWAVAAARAGADLLLFTSGKTPRAPSACSFRWRAAVSSTNTSAASCAFARAYGEPALVATNAATSRIFCALSCWANEGMPPPPLSTFANTWA